LIDVISDYTTYLLNQFKSAERVCWQVFEIVG